jgi:hypothetical protein
VTPRKDLAVLAVWLRPLAVYIFSGEAYAIIAIDILHKL